MVYKFIQLKLQKHYLVMVLILVVFGLLHAQNVYAAPDFEKHYLTELDAQLNRLVDHCVKIVKVVEDEPNCVQQLEDAWWMDCAFDYDKLDTCKNGKIENFLKGQGKPT